jgi:hypothetical protein
MMTRIALAPLTGFLLLVGCAEASMPGTPGSKTSGNPTCDPAIAMMTTGSQSVIGTRTITKITNKSGQTVQQTPASGCAPSSSVCEVPAGSYAVGGPYAGVSGVSASPVTQVGLIDGPTNSQCSEDQTVTVDMNEIEEMATITSLSEDPNSPYVVDITAIWPASQ